MAIPMAQPAPAQARPPQAQPLVQAPTLPALDYTKIHGQGRAGLWYLQAQLQQYMESIAQKSGPNWALNPANHPAIKTLVQTWMADRNLPQDVKNALPSEINKTVLTMSKFYAVQKANPSAFGGTKKRSSRRYRIARAILSLKEPT